MENLVIEAVSNKFANKYNAGSVLANGKWYQVSSKLNLDYFKKGAVVTVTTKTNDKGYTSIIGLDESVSAEMATEAPITMKKTKSLVAEVSEKVADKSATKTSFEDREDTKNKRILVQGIIQAVIQSPFMVNHTKEDAAEVAIEVALKLIKFTIDQTK